ncbi:uncharacterized protein MPTK1_4g12820 [Marchantia polymorpha subsp. ruderalis]|uniref:Alpha-L-arabinofuranosidase B arabinose-binding domain-containing protein n=2 Tax=Marchantia polymorpha TaxID=3197 RepID=A0AAF6B9B2_MARPO|nr:hypothetical protein MARPO_0138s0019 [Marchantia polymorpha]BBN08596.1 hypothetical protein Mp_4g12820 [Marchantia polymorpha subsp. ruderalis]|eukprot:PTQ29582.1 hypothetical protein MARPO_0138s0019 [Marchantia polymorpha]
MAMCEGRIVTILLGFLALSSIAFTHVLAKECTNIPTQSSHTLRALAFQKNASYSRESDERGNFASHLLLRKHAGSIQSVSERHRQFGYRSPRLEGIGSFQQPALREVSLHRVTLDAECDEGRAQETNLRYLLSLDVDRLVWSFRTNAGLPAPGTAYGGWETPGQELRGHFVGHYLSATALMWASTHNTSILEKMYSLVDALEECQVKMGTGYLSAFPSTFFDRFEAIEPVWAPYYTIHKIMAGLLDQYTLGENQKALDMLVWMAKYFLSRVEAVIENHTIERHWTSLNEEVGGMNDVMYRLYMLTEDPEHLKLAHLFDKPCFLGPLALKTDGLSGFHANTHIPLVVGAQMRYESTGDKLYKEIAEYFMEVINTTHRYATGGTSSGEFWSNPHRQGHLLTTETQESCTTYNILKIARNLYRWTKDVSYAEYYERALVNGVLGIQRGEEPGVMIYMLPELPGSSKALSYHGWGTPFDSMWCCYGTGIESFSKLGDSIYFEDGNDELYVMRFASSSLLWTSAGLLLKQKVHLLTSEDQSLRVTFEFKFLPEQGGFGKKSRLSVRIPSWATPRFLHVKLNGRSSFQDARPGSYLTFSRSWKVGDRLEIEVPVSLTIERVQDDRQEFSSLHAILYGPYVLAGMTDGDNELGNVDSSSLASWLVPVPVSFNDQLYSFSQRAEHNIEAEWSGKTSQIPNKWNSFVSERNGSVEMKSAPQEGTNEAASSTFRVLEISQASAKNHLHKSYLSNPEDSYIHRSEEADVDQTGKSSSNFPIMFGLIALEPYSKPGKVLAHNGPDSKIVVLDRIDNLNHHVQQINAEFRIIPGLSGDENSISFEAESDPGCFITTCADHSATLRCKKEKAEDATFDPTASFTVTKGLASYHRMSFFAVAENSQYLLFPIYAYRDEKYTMYFNFTNMV